MTRKQEIWFTFWAVSITGQLAEGWFSTAFLILSLCFLFLWFTAD